MVRVATEQAQAQLAELVRRASQGETILITQGGKPMAKLVPANDAIQHSLNHDEALRTLRAIRSRSQLAPGETIGGLIQEGRKY